MNLEKNLGIAMLTPMGDPVDDDCRWGLNVMLWGEPGIGKSDRIEAAAAMVGLPPHTLYAATTQPEDVSGAAFPNASMGVAMMTAGLVELHRMLEDPLELQEIEGVFSLPKKLMASMKTAVIGVSKKMLEVARRYGPGLSSIEPLLPGIRDLIADGQGVLFLDELSCARPAVQAAFLGVVLGRKVGGIRLPPGVRIIAAANPPTSAAGGWELEPPMANRFCHFNVATPTHQEWSDWLMSERGRAMEPIDRGEARVRANWHDHWPVVKGLVAGFLQSQPSLLHSLPEEGSPARGGAWPSPRTWVFAARAMATCKCLGVDQSVMIDFVEGCVGEGASVPFATWLMHADLPHPLHVLQHGWTIDKQRLDRCVAVYTSIVAYVTGRSDEKERLDLGALAWKRLQQACDANMLDLVVRHAHLLVKAGIDTKASTAIAEAAQPVMVRLAKAKMGQYLEK